MNIATPHIYVRNGKWKCARRSGVWLVWPYGQGDSPLAAYCDFLRRMIVEQVA